MRITKYEHSCLLVEEGEARLLIDPGEWSRGFEGLTDLDAILITHQHSDHAFAQNLKQLLVQNSGAQLLTDSETAEVLAKAGLSPRAVHEGDKVQVAGLEVEAIGSRHAEIHPDIPGIANVGYLVAGRFFCPGDALTQPGRPVEVLAAPSVAPWMKISEAVDYVRAVKPKFAVPVHDAITTKPEMYNTMLARLTEAQGVEVRVLEPGRPEEF